MSSNGKQQPPQAGQAAQPGEQQHFPPPPPGPPPIQTSQTAPPKHSNETPLPDPDYHIPAYDPAHPHFAPPPTAADEDIYNASPTDAHPPKWGQQAHHDGEGGGHDGKKPHRFAALGAAFSSKVAGPVNALAHKFGSEGFLPESLDKECEKAARILRGFCKDGIYSDTVPPTASGSVPPAPATTASAEKPPASPSDKHKKSRVLLTIPSKVIARAQGLAIFTAVRLGFQATGSSGSGILLARLPDGSWSPPSGIQVTSIGAGFVAGVDIYDCVIVINTREALDLFTKTRLSLGSDLAVTAGPFGAGGALGWGVPTGSQEHAQHHDRGRDGETTHHPATLAPPQQQQPQPLSPDKTHFQTGPVPEHEQGMGDEDQKDKARKEKRADRQPSPFREAIKKPVYSYVKSRGLFAGVQIDGTVIAERDGANARFYGQPVPVAKILRGEVPAHGPPGMWPAAARGLLARTTATTAGPAGEPRRPRRKHHPFLPTTPSPGTTTSTSTSAGAAPSTWIPPPPPPHPETAGGIPAATAGMQSLHLGEAHSAAGPSTAPPGAAATATTSAASAKAAEAAAEAAQFPPPPPPPPMYSDALQQEQPPHDADDLPPAYVETEESERYRAAADSKAGLH
ncbi:9e79671f-dcb9-48c4-8c62-d2d6280d6c71 [Thermothielavioides terrestris]|uniref:9e79671f-dcb9-48c4-8c62-d2d6280d6c71 n=1 Tax=Thermothielavioides terrestris TaxID=2587410 RepID=A0A3S4D6R6_9PEZI|nr:9e79671f-dcb9-48c4-8c62-d2d6280d6c71 [Thermothielavioides terrestris]